MEPTKAPETVAKEVLTPLAQLGLKVPTKYLAAIALLAITVPLLMLGWKWLKGRKARRAAMREAEGEGGEPVHEFVPGQLRAAWLRFERTLPASYRRSLHNFEHVIVVGEAGSGKSTLIDACTDWQRQSKQFLKSQTNDPDLQVYLGSSVIATELPSSLFHERGAKVRAALQKLWAPLYRVESPVVVVTLNVQKLRESRPEAITDIADRIRGMVNVLSGVGRRAVQVRVVATHLDEMPGWNSVASLWRSNTIPLRIHVDVGEGAAAPKAQIDAWVERATAQISRSLTQLPAPEFRKTLRWLKEAPTLASPLATFVEAITAKEAVSRDIIFGGVYLAAVPHPEPNPLRFPKPPGFFRDPTVRHLMAASIAATLVACFLLAVFAHQKSIFEPAAVAIAEYNPALVGTDAEEVRRDAIAEFAWKDQRILSLYPNFFWRPRAAIRARASELIRNQLLIPDLRTVAATGHIHEEHWRSIWRRTLYHLGLIHADKYDGMHILAPDRLEAWSSMTELPPDLIRDFIMMTDVAWVQPVNFEVRVGTSAETQAADQISYWTSFLGEVERTMELPSLTEDDVKRLQERTAAVMPTLERFTYDGVFRTIMPNLDGAASMAPGQRGKVVQLEAAYRPRYAEILSNIHGSDMYEQRDQLNSLLRTIIKAKLHKPNLRIVPELNSYLASLYDAPEDPSADKKTTIRVAGRDYVFNMRKWALLLRDSEAALSAREFCKARKPEESIFFSRTADEDLRPVTWNATNDGTAVFLGSAKIRGRYSRAAYDTHVYEPVVALDARLAKAKLPKSEESELRTFVSDELRAYALEYHAESAHFAESFSVGANSSQALRVALAQMTADVSPFIQFIDATSNQANAPTDSPLLESMRDLMEDMAPWKSLGTGLAGGEFGKYRAILSQLLTDLVNAGGGASGEETTPKASASLAKEGAPHGKAKAAPGEASPSEAEETLEESISPAARVALSGLRADKGSYAGLVRDWLHSIHMSPVYFVPFLSPLTQLDAIGRNEVSHVVRRVWEAEMLNDVASLSTKFPFDRTSHVEATPDEIDAVMNPITGKFFTKFRNFIEPISEVAPGRPFRELPVLRGSIMVPDDLFATVNEVTRIASQLYDGSGKPTPIRVEIEPVRFDHGANVRASVTAMFIGIGDSTVYSFNQRPTPTTLDLDWTHEHVSQVGVQLTNLTTRESSFGDAVATPSSYFSLLQLLTMGSQTPVGADGAKTGYSWMVHPESGSDEKIRVRFDVLGDPIGPLRLTRRKKVGGAPLRPTASKSAAASAKKESPAATPAKKGLVAEGADAVSSAAGAALPKDVPSAPPVTPPAVTAPTVKAPANPFAAGGGK